uniref:Amino acid transporter transmembrane domain-containing protein n=1 Tax=Guillardia theta (strain CCMP2712) TaxID=905079 RepID=A0A0C3UDE5_GUITC
MGGKSLGFFSSIVIVVNNIAGPGMLVLPKVYQDAGWFVPTVVLFVICIASSLAAILLTDAMARVPGNSRFQRRIEFVNVFEEFWGHRGMQLAQGMFIVNMMAQISSSIISNAQVMDSFIVFLNPRHTTYALQVWPTLDIISWSPPLKAILQPPVTMEQSAACHQGKVIPFNDPEESRAIISLGYLSLALILIPMSIMNLEENIFIQKISFYMLLLLSAEFLMQFYMQGMGNHEVPAFGHDYSHVLGSIVFNFAFIVVVPSWVNEKKAEVGIAPSIWISTFFSTILYVATGWMGAMAYYRAEGNFLNTLSNACSPTITRVSAFLFAFGMIGLGIPFICIVTRYSLLVGRVCGPRMSHFWAIFFPWLVSWVFYEGGLFNELIAWSGDLALGPINFVFP